MMQRIKDIWAQLHYWLLVNKCGEIVGGDLVERQVFRVSHPDEAPIGGYHFVPVDGHYRITRVLYRGKDIYNDGKVYWVFCRSEAR